MADLKRWPMALNQPGYEYPAELFRAEHHDETSGGNGVGAPTALKVTAQAAPDGTVSILPGGATVKSTYAGADGQSYHARNFQPFTLEVPPTGSSAGGRTDLVILRVCDPQYDVHPDHGGGEISAEDAGSLDFWWFELLQGKDRNASLSYPHVKLAEIVRPANITIVTDAHITDLRELANPKSSPHAAGGHLVIADTQALGSVDRVFPNESSHFVRFPEFATRVVVIAKWNSVRPGDAAVADATGRHWVRFTPPSGGPSDTLFSRWVVPANDRRDFSLALEMPVYSRFRGQLVEVDLMARKESGPNPFMDGSSSWAVQLFFVQDVD